ncbi:hypothetical protein A3F00_05200 [Candidatus Daviesbacteria bacterium RIFCSPHIGHO2_12_FULL_37_11]|uniref:Damage-inducible protein J n=1 Tax=Candidatus Daviesbacteria bacterium RIFCSPHIGHO2_12_FULL_37_11 TaxID=1797777 RepID=A0A1F5KA29_9BACT|nr:MAG: hypothetical protein A2769_00760 [Candidatus Daviesbacteria bacterium RIFCSPHIGHO2_01_FULL_37_27]OGE37776.1 MAG: hypothetical protein A3F00_05200 [Candidatus Daviesbacteria bacterium RIFCSPHIGHO2_12_FULL_37_11]
MNTTGIYLRMNPDIKQKAQKVASELGFSLSSLINAYIRQLVKTKRVDFRIEEEPSDYLLSAMKKARENRKAGKGSPIFDNVEDDLKWLKEQGV